MKLTRRTSFELETLVKLGFNYFFFELLRGAYLGVAQTRFAGAIKDQWLWIDNGSVE